MLKMRKFSSYLILILAVLVCSSGIVGAQEAEVVQGLEPEVSEASIFADAEAFIDGIIATQLEVHKIPGASVALVHNDQVLMAKGYGLADVERGLSTDSSTMFRPGSVSKLFIWTAVMQLVEQGMIDLDVDINNYLDFTIPATFSTPITMLDLMNHRAGFEDQVQELFVLSSEDLNPLDTYLKNNIPEQVFAPGTVTAYSNYGAALAAYIVERVSGMDYYTYVNKYIFTPLGMNQSTFDQPRTTNLAASLANGYVWQSGSFIDGGFEYVQPYPAGGLSTSATDMAKFMIAHLIPESNNDVRLLAPDTLAQMHTQSYAPHPDVSGNAHGFLEINHNDQRILSHGGDTILFHSGLYLIPSESVGLYVSYNGANAGGASWVLMQAFMERYFPGTEQSELKPVSEFAKQRDLYAGTFHFSRTNYSRVESLLRLMEQSQVTIDEHGYLNMGNTRYLQSIPGVFTSLDGTQKLVANYATDGQVQSFATEGPGEFLRTQWYELLLVNAILVIGFTVIVIVMCIKRLVGIKNKQIDNRIRKPYRVSRSLKIVQIIVGVIWLALIISLAVLIFDSHPVWGLGLPMFIFSAAPEISLLTILSYAYLVACAALVLGSLDMWRKQQGSMFVRLSYTVYTMWALALIWWLFHWCII